jgi:hypothetical protein
MNGVLLSAVQARHENRKMGPHPERAMAIDGRSGVAAHVPIVAVLLAALACGGEGPVGPGPIAPTPSPSPSGLPGVTPGRATGPTVIALVAAEPSAGATIQGCGSEVAGCAGRLRMTFRLVPSGTGSVLRCVGFLHAADKTACLQGRADGFTLRAGEPQDVDVVFDVAAQSERCHTPLDTTDLAFVVEGTIEVASRQEWAVHYLLAP